MAQGAFEREAKALIRRLERAGARIERRAAGYFIDGRETRRGRRLPPLDPKLIEAMAAQGLIESVNDGCYRPASLGRERPESEHGGVLPRRNLAESPLSWLKSRKGKAAAGFLEEDFEAGERLRADYTLARLEPRLTVAWDLGVTAGSERFVPRPGTLAPSERALAAKQRYFKALDAVGPELALVLVEVCCLASGIEAAERRLGWPRRAGKVVLKLALAALARHYGLTKQASAASRSGIRHWGADGYRPGIAPG
jgi:hypothetical protein